MKVTRSFELNHPWERVAEVLVDPAFNVELEKIREGVVSTEHQLVSKDERRQTFELHTIEYKRKKTGGLDRSGTVKAVTTFRYDSGARSMSWDYRGEGGGMVQLGGVYRLEPKGDRTLFVHDVTIEVKLPLIGGQIAKLIAKQFEKDDPRYQRLWEKYLDGR